MDLCLISHWEPEGGGKIKHQVVSLNIHYLGAMPLVYSYFAFVLSSFILIFWPPSKASQPSRLATLK